jgi:putative endopeptidase
MKFAHRSRFLYFCWLACWAFCGCQTLAATSTPLNSLPYTPGLDPNAMDRSANPCVDFYQFACGGWIKNNPIPDDQSRWSVSAKQLQENQRFLWGMLEKLSTSASNDPNQKKLGDYFAACMNETAIEKLNDQPLKRFFDRIDNARSKDDLASVVGELQMKIPRSDPFFWLEPSSDLADSSNIVVFVHAGGLGLPDREYYLKSDDKAKDFRNRYLSHIQKMFALVGIDSDRAKRNASIILDIETALAKNTLTNVEKRDPYKLFHKVNAKKLKAMAPQFSWDGYFHTVIPSKEDSVVFNASEPRFLKGFSQVIASSSLDDLKNYLRWHVLHAMAPYLSSTFVQEDFDFYQMRLRGTKGSLPRWKRCVNLIDDQMGETLGQEFVRRTFTPDTKARVQRMAKRIEDAMSKDIHELSWMGAATKKRALEKLTAIVNKIGYPDNWRNYDALIVKRDDFAGNVERGQEFEFHRQVSKIGKPLDRSEWFTSVASVNAEYNDDMNDITVAAGLLQPPLYDSKMDDAPSYGDMGGTIGHELTHAFDDHGRQFDARGNLKNWWTKDDGKSFEKRADCIVDQFKQYIWIDDLKVNSRLTEGEDIADLGGLILAWNAWKTEIGDSHQPGGDGLTPAQRFFVGYAQWACENTRPEALRLRAQVAEHSPGKYRVNGVVVNMQDFASAFACTAGQPMVKENRCRVW